MLACEYGWRATLAHLVVIKTKCVFCEPNDLDIIGRFIMCILFQGQLTKWKENESMNFIFYVCRGPRGWGLRGLSFPLWGQEQFRPAPDDWTTPILLFISSILQPLCEHTHTHTDPTAGMCAAFTDHLLLLLLLFLLHHPQWSAENGTMKRSLLLGSEPTFSRRRGSSGPGSAGDMTRFFTRRIIAPFSGRTWSSGAPRTTRV